MSKSDLIDITCALHVESAGAYLISETGDEKRAKCIPKSQCEIERTGKLCSVGSKKFPIIVATMPEWMAINKELV